MASKRAVEHIDNVAIQLPSDCACAVRKAIIPSGGVHLL